MKQIELIYLYSSLYFFQQTGNTYLVSDDIIKLGDIDTFLLHSIAEAQCYRIVFQRIIIHSYTIWSTYSILTTITLTYRILLVIMTIKVEFQIIDNFTCLFRKTVFLDKRHHTEFHRCQRCRKVQHDT